MRFSDLAEKRVELATIRKRIVHRRHPFPPDLAHSLKICWRCRKSLTKRLDQLID
jgi:hypothetical protein